MAQEPFSEFEYCRSTFTNEYLKYEIAVCLDLDQKTMSSCTETVKQKVITKRQNEVSEPIQLHLSGHFLEMKCEHFKILSEVRIVETEM
jgi:hypothetical protein